MKQWAEYLVAIVLMAVVIIMVIALAAVISQPVPVDWMKP